MIRVLDCETTGLDPKDGAEVCEIGWADVSPPETPGAPWTVGTPQSALVKPGRAIPPEMSAIHHITNADVAASWPLADTLTRCCVFSRPEVEAYASHVRRFEQAFLGAPWDKRPWLDTWKVAIVLAPRAPSHKNQALRYWLNLAVDPALASPPHRAGPDAYVTAHLLARMLAKLSVAEMVEISERPAILPRFHFGKHAGEAVETIPTGYLEWVLANIKDDPDVRATAFWHLTERRKTKEGDRCG